MTIFWKLSKSQFVGKINATSWGCKSFPVRLMKKWFGGWLDLVESYSNSKYDLKRAFLWKPSIFFLDKNSFLWKSIFDHYGFSIFYCFYKEFLYWPLQSPLWGPFSPKSIQKSFFSDFDFLVQGCWGFEPTLQKCQVGPKRHPKSLVCASERYSRKYPQIAECPKTVLQTP